MSDAADAPAPVRIRDLTPVTLIAFLGFAAIAMPLPALSLHLHEALGLGPIAVGWMISAQSIVTVISRNRIGRIVDVLGPKRGLVLGLPLAVMSGVSYAVAPAFADARVALSVILLGRLVLGLAESFVLTSTVTLAIARVGAGATGTVIAWQGIAIYAAIGLGAPAGLLLQHAQGFAVVGLAAAIPPLLGLALALALHAPSAPPVRSAPVPLREILAEVYKPGLVVMLATLAYAAVGSFLPLLYAERGWRGAELAFTGFALGFIVVRLLDPRSAARFGGWRVVTVSLAVEAIGQAILWNAASPLAAALGATLTGGGFSLIFPAMGVEAVRGVAAARRGQAYANFSAFSDVTMGGTGPLLGFAIARFGYDAPFAAGSAAALAGLLVVALRRRSAI